MRCPGEGGVLEVARRVVVRRSLGGKRFLLPSNGEDRYILVDLLCVVPA